MGAAMIPFSLILRRIADALDGGFPETKPRRNDPLEPLTSEAIGELVIQTLLDNHHLIPTRESIERVFSDESSVVQYNKWANSAEQAGEDIRRALREARFLAQIADGYRREQSVG